MRCERLALKPGVFLYQVVQKQGIQGSVDDRTKGNPQGDARIALFKAHRPPAIGNNGKAYPGKEVGHSGQHKQKKAH